MSPARPHRHSRQDSAALRQPAQSPIFCLTGTLPHQAREGRFDSPIPEPPANHHQHEATQACHNHRSPDRPPNPDNRSCAGACHLPQSQHRPFRRLQNQYDYGRFPALARCHSDPCTARVKPALWSDQDHLQALISTLARRPIHMTASHRHESSVLAAARHHLSQHRNAHKRWQLRKLRSAPYAFHQQAH